MKLKRITAILTALTLILITIPTAAAEDFIAVTSITGVSTNATAGTQLMLDNATVQPVNATNQAIVWTVADQGSTGASISGAAFNASGSGTAIITATIASGSGEGVNYTQDFTISVNMPFIGVTDITGIPANQTAGTFLLEGVISPANATSTGIVWSLVNAGTTGASVSGNSLTTTNTGTVLIRATIENGLTSATHFVKDFSINIGTQTITSVSVQIPAPETFGLRPTTATLPTNSNFTVNSVTWRVGTTNFTGASFLGNTRYTVDITIAANSGFTFADGSSFIGRINATAPTNLVRNTNGTITMSLEFPSTRATSVLPTAPQNFKAEPGNNQVRLTWTAPQNTGGSNIVRYQLSYGLTTGYTRQWDNIPNSSGTTVAYTVTGLENDKEYTFELRAVNQAYGGGVATSAIRSMPVGTATAPQNFRVSPGNNHVLISWTPPSFTGGTITGYEYSYAPSGSYTESWDEVPRTGSGVPLNYVVEDVTNGVEYTFQVRAVNSNGEGTASAKINGMPAVNIISAPRSFSATAGNEQVVLSWNTPQSLGGNTITKYQYSQITTSGNPTWRDVPDSNANTNSFTITGLTNGTTYFFEVRAVAGSVLGSTSGVRVAAPAAAISNSTTSVDNRAGDIQTAANNNTGQTITVTMASGSNSISKAVLDSIRGKNVILSLDYGALGRITINGTGVNSTNGASTLNMNLQRTSGTATMIAEYAIPKTEIDARNPLPVHQLKIGSGSSVAINGTVTVNVGDANSGRNAILCRYNATSKQFEVINSSVIASNGTAAIEFTGTGDYLIIVQRDGDVNGNNEIGTDDALEILRAVAGIIKLDPVQLHVASTRRDSKVETGDAMAILRRVAGLTVS
ncbi:MAG: fibronectin type III domain-containing protein [Oscillospiraceae bacterium]|nr:fibronectin type III domain-containing protein [Oscillospiraceae bacterium]